MVAFPTLGAFPSIVEGIVCTQELMVVSCIPVGDPRGQGVLTSRLKSASTSIPGVRSHTVPTSGSFSGSISSIRNLSSPVGLVPALTSRMICHHDLFQGHSQKLMLSYSVPDCDLVLGLAPEATSVEP